MDTELGEALSVTENHENQKRFASDEAPLKQLYLVKIRVTDKWTMPIRCIRAAS